MDQELHTDPAAAGSSDGAVNTSAGCYDKWEAVIPHDEAHFLSLVL